MAENVGYLSLRTDAAWAMIASMTRPRSRRARDRSPRAGGRPVSAAPSTRLDASQTAGRPAPLARRSQRNVVVRLFDGVQSLDVSGPVEVLAALQRVPASSERSLRGYDIRT